jgi:hypothetical protein
MPFSSGRPETLCGAGSTLENTTSVRGWIPFLFRQLGERSLLDAPCGDFNWMARTNLSGIDYSGVDYDGEHLAKASTTVSVPDAFAPNTKRLLHLDIVNDGLPKADVVLCREFLQHLPNDQVRKVIKNIADSGAKWLLATSHNAMVNSDIAAAGMFRPLNLMAEPFCFPCCRSSVGDQLGTGRILGLWHRSDFE